MIISFKNQGAHDIFDGKNTKEARKTCPASLNRVATRKLDQINAAISLQDLRMPPNNRLETLLGDRAGNIVFASTLNIAFALSGQKLEPNKSKSSTTTNCQ